MRERERERNRRAITSNYLLSLEGKHGSVEERREGGEEGRDRGE